MSILTSDLVLYGPLSNPTDDVSASGGTPDFQRRPVFTQLLANSVLVYQSNGADTRGVQAVGRDSTGSVVTETVILNGAAAVTGSQVFERLQSVSLTGGVSGAQIVTVGGSGIGAGGGGLFTIPATELGIYMNFRNAASAASPTVRYEKMFFKNKNASLTLQSAQVQLLTDPSTVLQSGVAATLNDSLSIANRLAVPGGISFVSVGVNQNVPTNALPAGQYVGVWISQNLAANNAAIRNPFAEQLSGTTV